jgi:hypothetical protein
MHLDARDLKDFRVLSCHRNFSPVCFLFAATIAFANARELLLIWLIGHVNECGRRETLLPLTD